MTVPARRPEDDALDRLLAIVEAAETQGRWILSGRDVINITQAAITVRLRSVKAIAQIKELLERAESAEAEVRRLTALKDEVVELSAKLERGLLNASAEIVRLKEGLREIERMAGAAGYGETPAKPIAEKARALLSASPSDGGGAK